MRCADVIAYLPIILRFPRKLLKTSSSKISLPSIAIIPLEPAIRHCSEIVVPALILPYNSISVMVLPRVVSALENIVLVHFPKYVCGECVCVHVCVNTIIFGFKTAFQMLLGLPYSVLCLSISFGSWPS